MVGWAGIPGPEAPALLAVGREALTYERLEHFVTETAGRLRAHGLGPQSRIALVVDNGPEAATAFLSIAQAAAVAPLNPVYREAELAFSLDDLGAQALVVGAELDSPAREIASERGIDVFELHVTPAEPAGVFTLSGLSGDAPAEVGPEPDDVALFLHTSGTTSRPKLVPLTHGRLAASARNVAETLRLEPADRCLNVMPLFHIHGLVAALLASLTAGASVGCTPGFHQLRFLEWLDELDPTWYTAVPTMHAAILSRAQEHVATLGRRRLRLIRSSSAALPVPVLEGLEATFGVPVIEAYGMTEAAHQMASNPLPPDVRKPGTVGRPTGLEIAILDHAGDELPVGDVGEVAIRGANVFSGYEANPEANEAAFTDGWFRTGDEGSLDGDGYLTLRGRIKEIINRGGEKISPLEIDEALLRHAAVEQAVTFAVADSRLGEEVAAAVVLAPDSDADERGLQDFVAAQLAPFKVPRRVLVVEEIPKGATGKVQRIGLAERLGAGAPTAEPDRPASGFLEYDLVEIWQSVLARPEIGVNDDFFALGGDSILGAEAVARVRNLVGNPDLPLASIVRAPTPAAMAREVFDHVGDGRWGTVPIRAGSRTPLFLVHPLDGDVLAFGVLGSRLASEQPLYGLRARGIDDGTAPHASLAEMATDYVAAVRDVQPRGPYLLGGYCMGAPVAVEIARRLEEDGERVAMLVLLDPRFRQPEGLRYREWQVRRDLGLAWARTREKRLGRAVKRRIRSMSPNAPEATEIVQALEQIREESPAEPFDLPATILISDEFGRTMQPTWHLKRIVRQPWRWRLLPGRHSQLLLPPNVDIVAAEIDAALNAAVGSSAAA
jgi:acyl-CoA synthetase (AMP-forming)/AMP-acid ligase II/thioesterase domain-containing protein